MNPQMGCKWAKTQKERGTVAASERRQSGVSERPDLSLRAEDGIQ